MTITGKVGKICANMFTYTVYNRILNSNNYLRFDLYDIKDEDNNDDNDDNDKASPVASPVVIFDCLWAIGHFLPIKDFLPS